ncbi:MAG: beta-lactamase family protein [Proteobacteria bacterium]|nr:beta-lactamase family protein [Pseudomonadota bacterium]
MRLAGAVLAICFTAGSALAQPAPGPSPAGQFAKTTAATPAVSADLTREDVGAWFDGFLPYALERADIAGTVVVVVKDGNVLFKKGYGYADVATKRPVDPDLTLFRPGSVSKLFTWTAVMQLVEQRQIDLDADVNTYLDFKIPPFDGKPITMRELMTHTPGFENALEEVIAVKPTHPQLGDFLKSWMPPRIFPAGEVPAYSNYGAALAGYIVQRISGQPFPDYIAQHIFAPLGMKHSTFLQPPPAALARLLSRGYLSAADAPAPFEMLAAAPAGGLSAPASDMAKFMIAHLQNGEYDGHRILQAATARQMHNSPYTTISPAFNRMTLGFFQLNRNGQRIIGHDGDTRFFHSSMALFLDHDVGLFISLNSAGRASDTFDLREKLFDDFTDRYFPGPTPAGKVPLAMAKAHAAMMAGQYDGSRREDTTFVSFVNLLSQTAIHADDSGRLVAPMTGLNGEPKTFEEIAPFLWRQVGGKELLAAKVADGKVVMWGEGNDPSGAYTPVSGYRNAAWLLPALELSFLALLLATIAWPVAAVMRRRYSAPLAQEISRARRWMHVAVAAEVLVMMGWLALIVGMMSTFYWTWAPYFVSSAMEKWVLVLHLLSIVVLPLATLIALWNVWATVSAPAGVMAKVWSVVLAASCLIVLWVGVVFHFIGLGLSF